jgi:hypothetical protein
MALTKQQFAEQFGGFSLAELKTVVKEGTGKELTATTKDGALAQAYRLHLEGQPAQAEPVAAPEPAPKPLVTADPTRPLVFEGRVTGELMSRHRAGYHFTRAWADLPEMTEEKRVRIQADRYLQIRIKG